MRRPGSRSRLPAAVAVAAMDNPPNAAPAPDLGAGPAPAIGRTADSVPERAGYGAPLIRSALRLGRWLKRFWPWAGLGFFALALWALHGALHVHSYRELAAALGRIPASSLLLSLLATITGYAVLTGHDVLAVRYVGRTLPLRDIGLAALLSNAIGNNIGNTLLTGSAVRYWIYTDAGLSALQVGRIVLFCSLGFWLGYLALCALAFLVAPLSLPATLQLGVEISRPLGVLALLLLATWLALCLRGRPFVLGTLRLELPSPPLTLGQVAIGAADLLLMATALYVLLPGGSAPGFFAFLAVFLIALVAGTASQVPGGLGVFEAVVVLLLGPQTDLRTLAAALLAFRAIYLVLPLLAAVAVVGVRGGLRLRQAGPPALQRLWQPLADTAPTVLGAMAFLSGAVLLLSGALPAAVGRLKLVEHLLALPVIEVSHFLASLVGAALLVVARGLQRRLDAAWWLAVGLLAGGALLSLAKGWDFEEAGVLAVALAALLPLRRQFYRRSSLLDTAFSPAWVASCAIVLGGAAWLTLFAHRDAALAEQAWWAFAWKAEASRSLRAMIGATGLLTLLSLRRLVRPARGEKPSPAGHELERARPIVEASRWTYANLVYRADKALLFSSAGDAFLMYGRMRRSWIAMGDPVGPEASTRELAWRFRELADRHDGWCVYFEVRSEQRALYAELGLTLTPLGEEARVELPGFSLDTPTHRDLRQACAKLHRAGCRFEIVERDRVPALLPTLEAISRAWLSRKATSEKGFSNASFDRDYLARFPAAIVRRGDEVVAFANLWLGAEREELSVDLMRHRPDAPNGTMDLLFSQLLLWGRAQGYRWFNFGMAPLAGLHAYPEPSVWTRAGAFVYRHAEHFYNFGGLRRYKAKYGPVWTPLYLASPGGLALAPVLVDVTALIAGGLGDVFVKHRRRGMRST
jgi:phosphatidylglycerol lysyltransferase